MRAATAGQAPGFGRRAAGGLAAVPNRWRALVCLALACLALAGQPAALAAQAMGARKAETACPEQGSASGRVAAVSDRLELTLEDSSRLKIAGVDPPRPTPSDPGLDATARRRLATWLAGQTVRFRLAEPGEDRWGRAVSFVYGPAPAAEDGRAAALLPVAEALIDAGLARYEPGAAARPCRSVLLAAEKRARAAGLGLWSDPYYAILDAGERESFAERSGSIVIVEGRVTGVDGQKPRIALRFGDRKGWDFSVAMVPKNSKAFEASYAALSRLTGQQVRVRGLLDTRFGPQIEISDPDAVELAGPEQGGAVSPLPR